MLEDWRTAPVDARVRAALGFLEKLTLTPEALTRDDADAARAHGVTDAMLEDVVYVCVVFSAIVRMADALGWRTQTPAQFAQDAKMLLARGYV